MKESISHSDQIDFNESNKMTMTRAAKLLEKSRSEAMKLQKGRHGPFLRILPMWKAAALAAQRRLK